jgi:hypothetical protein
MGQGAGEELAAGAVKVAVIVTAVEGIVAVVVGKDGFARITTSPVQPTKCVPAGAGAAVTVTSVPFSSPLAVPLFTVNSAIDPENDATTNAIAPKSTLQCVFIIIRFLVVLCDKDQHDGAGYDGIRLLLSLPQMGEICETFCAC